MTNEQQIVYEGFKHWVFEKDLGWFEVYRKGATASERVATVHYSTEPTMAREKAISECIRRDFEYGTW